MSIEGTYRLVRCTVIYSDGITEHPYGEDAEGLLIYAPTGHFSGHLMRRGVGRFRTGARKAAAEETRAAFLGYLGYFGTYAVDGAAGTVTHTVLGSWHPNWVGTDQVRHYRRNGAQLVIETPAIRSGGRARFTRLTWRRVEAATE